MSAVIHHLWPQYQLVYQHQCNYTTPQSSSYILRPVINVLLLLLLIHSLTEVVPASIIEPPLKGIQILFIICAIMFLTLVLLGLGVSYYCLKRRPIPVVRRLPMSMGSGSEITKLSGSSLGKIASEMNRLLSMRKYESYRYKLFFELYLSTLSLHFGYGFFIFNKYCKYLFKIISLFS